MLLRLLPLVTLFFLCIEQSTQSALPIILEAVEPAESEVFQSDIVPLEPPMKHVRVLLRAPFSNDFAPQTHKLRPVQMSKRSLLDNLYGIGYAYK